MGRFGIAADQIFAACGQTPNLYRDLLSAYDPSINSNRVKLRCPSCGDFSGWVIPGDRVIRCDHQNNCGRETHVLAAMIGSNAEMLSGDTFGEAVEEAARITGVQIEAYDHAPNAEYIPIPKEALEAVWEYCNDSITDRTLGTTAFDYLVGRGFTESFIAANFGYLDRVDDIGARLDAAHLKALGILDSLGCARKNKQDQIAWDERIVIPCRNAYGKLVGLIGRCIASETRKDKYVNSTGYKRGEHPFGLHLARKQKRVIVTEGHMDVLKLNQHGVYAAIAAGSNHLSAAQLNLFKQHEIDNVICFFDMDSAGELGVTKLLDAFDEEKDTPELFIGELPGQAKDPDEYIEMAGLQAFLQTAKRAIHAHRYRAQLWFKGLDRDGLGILLDGQLPQYIERCAEYLDSLKTARAKLRADTFLSEVCKLSGVDRADIRAVRKEFFDSRRKKDNQTKLSRSLGAAYASSRDGSIDQARALVRQALIDTSTSKSTLCQPEDAWDEVSAYFKRIASRELIGVKTHFRPYDDNLSGARGLMLVAGQTNVGKTIKLGQLAADIATKTDDTCVLFLSFEMLRREIYGRLLARSSETDWINVRNFFKDEFGEEQSYWQGVMLEGILRNTAIIHPQTDSSFRFSPGAVIDEMNALKERTGRPRCMIIVDYLDVVPGYEEQARGNENIRQQWICDDMLKIKSLMSEDDPLLCVTSVRKSSGDREWLTFDDVMGSSRRIYCSDIVVIWNRFSDRFLYEHCDLTNDFHAIIPHAERIESDWKKIKDLPETRWQLRRAYNVLKTSGVGFSHLELAKVRDGMRKDETAITVNYLQNFITEGLKAP